MMDPLLLDSLGGLDADTATARLLFQTPAFRYPVDLIAIPPRLIDPPGPAWHPGFPAFLKLGAKSWRDSGRLRIVQEHCAFLAAATALLSTLTSRQRRYLNCVRDHSDRLDLAVFPYVDFSDISEIRWRCREGRASLSSWCFRGASAACAGASREAMRDLVYAVMPSLPSSFTIDLAIEPEGRISILEINPPAGTGK